MIYYRRRDSERPRISDYFRIPLACRPKDILYVMTCSQRILGSVKKIRTVYYDKSVKINIDHVERLGDFVELEAASPAGGTRRARRLLQNTKLDWNSKRHVRLELPISTCC